MKQLWAPWRMEYILQKKSKTCLFCKISPLKNKSSKKGITKGMRSSYILCQGNFSYVVLNTFPYNNGHLMIIPYRHLGHLEKLNEEEMMELMKLTIKATRALKKVLSPHGFNVGINLGRTAGAGVADHLHLHIVPRWEGDSNFMPLISDTKIISQSLKETYEKLLPFFKDGK